MRLRQYIMIHHRSKLTFNRVLAHVLVASHQTQFGRASWVVAKVVYLGHAAGIGPVLLLSVLCLPCIPLLLLFRPNSALQAAQEALARFSAATVRGSW